MSDKELEYYLKKLECSTVKIKNSEIFNEGNPITLAEDVVLSESKIKTLSKNKFETPSLEKTKKNLDFTTEQKLAVDSINGDYLVVAGAGTGKTRTIISRVVEMEKQGIPLENILILTFTRKSCEELQERGERLGLGVKVPIKTFHSLCFNLLKRQGDYFKLLEDHEKKIVESYIQHEKLQDIREEYLKGENYLDFYGIIEKIVLKLGEDTSFLETLSNQYRYIMVDEYQDSDRVQIEFLKFLNKQGSQIMLIGDDVQSIYGFRGADFRNILLYKRDFPSGHVIKFQKNFRSTGEIVNFTNGIFKNLKWKIKKEVTAQESAAINLETKKEESIDRQVIKPKIFKPQIVKLGSLKDEGEYIALSIKKLLREISSNETIGILYRNKHLKNHIEMALKKYEIEYSTKVQRESRKDCVIREFSYLYNFFRRVTIMNLEKIRTTINESSAEAGIKTSELFQIIKESLELGESFRKTPEELLKKNHMELGRYEELRKTYKKINNIKLNGKKKNNSGATQKIIDIEILELYRKFNIKKIDLEWQVALIEKSFKEGFFHDKILEAATKKARVELITVHSSKGLEWDWVYIPTVTEGIYPKKGEVNSFQLEEELRIFYVACSRAKKSLTLTYPEVVHWFSEDLTGMSSFIKMLDKESYIFQDKSITK